MKNPKGSDPTRALGGKAGVDDLYFLDVKRDRANHRAPGGGTVQDGRVRSSLFRQPAAGETRALPGADNVDVLSNWLGLEDDEMSSRRAENIIG